MSGTCCPHSRRERSPHHGARLVIGWPHEMRERLVRKGAQTQRPLSASAPEVPLPLKLTPYSQVSLSLDGLVCPALVILLILCLM